MVFSLRLCCCSLCLYIFLLNVLLERISLEKQNLRRISFHVYNLRNSKMAAPMDGPKPNDIARCLNALALMNMQDIASADIISDLVNDYFITR